MNATSATGTGAQNPVFKTGHRAKAPRDLVWRMWTEAEHLVRWWGAAGCTVGKCDLDLRVDGSFHYQLIFPNGMEVWGKFVFREITAPDRLVVLNGFSNPEGDFAASPFPGDWPRQMLTVITFKDLGDETEISLTSEPFNATEAQQATFAATMPSMFGGWGGTFARLDDHLKDHAN
ncbi:MAG: SRPBCC domain-containing protein [Alphaproteobacteria bacterium]|tara:strand:+ start:106 stop:633 length:528 start_codon:yes stop_codon:yes gene_type:complete